MTFRDHFKSNTTASKSSVMINLTQRLRGEPVPNLHMLLTVWLAVFQSSFCWGATERKNAPHDLLMMSKNNNVLRSGGKAMKILRRVQKIPGGMMIIPLVLGAIVNTFFPNALNIGSFTTATFGKGAALTIIGFSLTCIGMQIHVREAPEVIKWGGVLLVVKYIAGAAIGLLIVKFFGNEGFFGLSAMAVICTVTNSNGGLYLALMDQYGEPADTGAQGLLNINDGPFLTMVTLGAAGLATIPLLSLFSALVPLLLGFILGNLDSDFGEYFGKAVGPAIPFLSFSLGASINLGDIVNSGFGGIILGVIVVLGSGIPLILADRYLLKRPGYAGAALATAAGNAVATPAAIAAVDPTLEPLVSSATTQVAAAVLVSALLTPVLTAWVVKRYGDARGVRQLGEPKNHK